MGKDYELSWEAEFSHARGRRALPGERAARFCSFGITEALAPLIASGLADVGLGTAIPAIGAAATPAALAGIETASIPIGALGAGATTAVAGGLASGLVGAGKGALTSAITGGNPLQGAAIGGLGSIGGSIAGDLGLGQSLGIGANAGGAIGGALGGLAGNALTGGKNPLTGLIGGAAAGYGTPSGLAPAPNTPALASAGSSAATGSTLSSGIGNLSPGGLNVPPVDLTASASGGIPGVSFGGTGGDLNIPGLSGGSTLPPDYNIMGFLQNTPTAAIPGSGQSPIPGLSPAPATAAAAPAAGGASSGGVSGSNSGSFLSQIGSSLKDAALKNPLQAIGLPLNILSQNQAQGALQKEVNQAESLITNNNRQASGLEAALFTGQLPPGAQAAVNQATQAAKAAVRSKYASLGLTGSSMEAQDIANVDQQAASQIFSLASDLYKTGISQSGLSAQLYDAILQAQGGLANESRNALTNYAAAIGGGPYANKTAT